MNFVLPTERVNRKAAKEAKKNGCKVKYSDYYELYCCTCKDERHTGDSQCSAITAKSAMRKQSPLHPISDMFKNDPVTKVHREVIEGREITFEYRGEFYGWSYVYASNIGPTGEMMCCGWWQALEKAKANAKEKIIGGWI